MPGDARDDEAWKNAVGVLYEPGTPDKPQTTRSTEMIWRSWETMENVRGGQDTIRSFQCEWKRILDGDLGTERQRIAQEFEGGFCVIPGGRMKVPWIDGRVGVKAYRLHKHCVTDEVYELFDRHYLQRRLEGLKAPDTRPAVYVDWYDAEVFCRWLGPGYRLPFEHEWEFACRAGSTKNYCRIEDPLGSRRYRDLDQDGDLEEVAWFRSNANDDRHPVGEKKPNAFGLYDVHGNIWEWCANWFASRVACDRDGVPLYLYRGLDRVLRGGSFHESARDCRAVTRSEDDPINRFGDLGFRVACNF